MKRILIAAIAAMTLAGCFYPAAEVSNRSYYNQQFLADNNIKPPRDTDLLLVYKTYAAGRMTTEEWINMTSAIRASKRWN